MGLSLGFLNLSTDIVDYIIPYGRGGFRYIVKCQQRPWILSPDASSNPLPQLWQSEMSPDTAKYPLGGQTPPPQLTTTDHQDRGSDQTSHKCPPLISRTTHPESGCHCGARSGKSLKHPCFNLPYVGHSVLFQGQPFQGLARLFSGASGCQASEVSGFFHPSAERSISEDDSRFPSGQPSGQVSDALFPSLPACASGWPPRARVQAGVSQALRRGTYLS